MLNITLALFCYTAATISQTFMPFHKKSFTKLATVLGPIAIVLHGYLLYHWIDIGAGHNLTPLNLLSLAIWVSILLIFLMGIKKPLSYLNLLTFPLAALSIYLVKQFPSNQIAQTIDPKQLTHILLSVLTIGILFIAGLQALILALQEKLIKQKTNQVFTVLPPIESMEKFLFQLIRTGFILLSLILITSLSFFPPTRMLPFLQKTTLTFITWLVFALLLCGHYFFGWRGKKAVYWTLTGVTLISVIYFNSLMIMELLP